MTQILEKPAEAQKAGLRAFQSILVHAEPELASSHRIEAAARLARETNARLIGVGAEALNASIAADPFGGGALSEWIAAATDDIEIRLKSAEQAFRRDAAGAEMEWRVARTLPNDALIQVARAADLVVMSAGAPVASMYRTASPAGVVLRAGRPVLLVPENGRHLQARTVVVGWKETREARRAIVDALPLLQRAEQVIVQAISEPGELEAVAYQANDVVDTLKRHGVVARSNVTRAHAKDVAQELDRTAAAHGADLIVVGAYGHSRLTEWVFGGVTNDLMQNPGRFILMSH